jgi:hypothetical protein
MTNSYLLPWLVLVIMLTNTVGAAFSILRLYSRHKVGSRDYTEPSGLSRLYARRFSFEIGRLEWRWRPAKLVVVIAAAAAVASAIVALTH